MSKKDKFDSLNIIGKEDLFVWCVFIIAIVVLFFVAYSFRAEKQDLQQQLKVCNENLNSTRMKYEGTSSEFKYLKTCLTNVENSYNDSYHHLLFTEICVREFATLNNMKIQNCLNFSYINGSFDFVCGFASTTIQTETLTKNNITNVSFFRRYKQTNSTLQTVTANVSGAPQGNITFKWYKNIAPIFTEIGVSNQTIQHQGNLSIEYTTWNNTQIQELLKANLKSNKTRGKQNG
ncbi:MAG: hypothetical protein A3K77_07585 [Euryarchaeota archaeon RBG_13_31_8]|nr:MAG: hypothetical protein A3K77_07585 [Euryarchaeota archaeon RBG_13_31_8]